MKADVLLLADADPNSAEFVALAATQSRRRVIRANTSLDAFRIRDGDLVGWSLLFPRYVWDFSARATKPTSAIFFYGTVLREYCEENHTLGFKLFKRMSEVMTRRLQLARTRLLQAYSESDTSGSREREAK